MWYDQNVLPHPLFQKQNKNIVLTQFYQKTNSVQHEKILFFQHSIHYILITITTQDKSSEKKKKITLFQVYTNVVKPRSARKKLRLKKGATNLARQKNQRLY